MKRAGIGDLDRRLVLEAPRDVPDDIGGVVRAWEFVDVVWARVYLLSGARRFEGEREESTTTHAITIRWRQDVTGAMRLRDGTRIYAILAAADGDDRRRTLNCRCIEIN